MATGTVTIEICDATCQPLTTAYVEILNAYHDQVYAGSPGKARVEISDIPMYYNFRDIYTVRGSAPGYRDTGFHPVKVAPAPHPPTRLMFLPRKCKYDFHNAGWEQMKQALPDLSSALVNGVSETEAQSRYQDLQSHNPEAAAGLLNITTAMQQICMPNGRTALNYLKRVCWDTTLARDRFFGWADAVLLADVLSAAAQGMFAEEPFPGRFHAGATCSYKQTQFDYGNVQLTFHEKDTPPEDGVGWVKVEPDIDLYKDLAAHGLFEVLPGFFDTTDPSNVFTMRWMAGESIGVVFTPLYEIESA